MKSEKILSMAVFGVVIATLVMVFSSFTGAAPASPPSNSTIGYVDMDKLQSDLPDFQTFRDQIKDKQSEVDMFKGYQLQKHLNNVKTITDKATQDKNGKSTDEQAAIDKKANEDIQKSVDDSKAQIDQKNAEANKYVNDLRSALLDKLKKLIGDVATDQKLSVVFDKSAIFFGGTDISQQVIDKGKKLAATSAKPSPTPVTSPVTSPAKK